MSIMYMRSENSVVDESYFLVSFLVSYTLIPRWPDSQRDSEFCTSVCTNYYLVTWNVNLPILY